MVVAARLLAERWRGWPSLAVSIVLLLFVPIVFLGLMFVAGSIDCVGDDPVGGNLLCPR